MKTLVIFDDKGKIFSQITGEYAKPIGLQHTEIEIPQGKVLVGINPTTREPIFEDIPKTETEMLNESLSETTLLIAQQQRQIELQDKALMELTMLIAGGGA